MEEKLEEEQNEVIIIRENSRLKKILIILAKILVFFTFPILVAILDHFIF